MRQLIVKLHGKDFARLEMQEERDYTIGRSPDCDIVLESAKGISRQHVRIVWQGHTWVAELLSKFGGLIYEGESVEVVELEHGGTFHIPPYEFHYYEEEPKQEKVETVTAPTNTQTPTDNTNKQLATIPNGSPEEVEGNMEATVAGVSHLIAILRVYTDPNDVGQVIKLEGNSWIAGRDDECEIHLNDSRVSRRHFRLVQAGGTYHLIDLGSANGTLVNGVKVTPDQPVEIKSGDTISIRSLTMVLEIRDSRFENKLQVIGMSPTPGLPTTVPWSPQAYPPTAFGTQDPYAPAVIKVESRSQWLLNKVKTFDYKKNKVRIAIAVAGVFLVLGLLFDDKPTASNQDYSSTGEVTFDKLTNEQKQILKDSLNLARSHFATNKFELCLAEIKKIHAIIPFYQNSKEIETLCAQASELDAISREKERMEREREQIQERIAAVIEVCKEQINNATTMESIEQCLAPAIELDPEHAQVLELKNLVRAKIEERQEQLARKQELHRLANIGESKYRTAKNLYEQGELRRALTAYIQYLSGNYPDPEGLSDQAKREMASVKKQLEEKVTVKFNECKKLHSENKFKAAIIACDEAIKEDPSEESVKSFRRQVLSDLRRDMKTLYQDAILEESLGNIEAAKQKWKQIVEEDISSDEYYQKANRQLKKYGAGL